jgi:nitrite reductase (NO-forming)
MRTFWMRLFGAANLALLLVFAYFFLIFIVPNLNQANSQAGEFLPVFIVFMVLFVLIAFAALLLPGAARRRWFWLIGAIPAVLVLLLFGGEIAYDLTHPTVASTFVSTLLGISASVATLVSGAIAFRQVPVVRVGGHPQTSPRTRVLLAAIAGALIGASATSVAAGTSVTGAGSVSEAPTATAVIEAKDTKFLQTTLQMKNGDVLGIFVINRDPYGHAFDIDSLNIHVALPPNSTTAVAIKPAATGSIEFYCSLPGHRAAGMLGTITVQ